MSFRIASRFREAASVINETPIEKFPLLLSRIVDKLHITNARLFSEEEETQLKTLFALTDEQLRLVLDGCCYVFEQAAFTSTGPEPLYAILLEAGFDQAHGKALGRLWASEAPAFIAKLKARTLGGPTLIDTDYHLNLVMGESSLTRLQEPAALFEFTIHSPDTSANMLRSEDISSSSSSSSSGAKTDIEKVLVEFSHGELYSFFGDLERIQQQLDALS